MKNCLSLIVREGVTVYWLNKKKWLKIQQHYIEQTKSVDFNKTISQGDTYDTSYSETMHRIKFFKKLYRR